MKKLLLTIGIVLMVFYTQAKDYALSTPNSTLILSADEGESVYFRYYGSYATIKELAAAGRLDESNCPVIAATLLGGVTSYSNSTTHNLQR